jgi:hypothetical protein
MELKTYIRQSARGVFHRQFLPRGLADVFLIYETSCISILPG